MGVGWYPVVCLLSTLGLGIVLVTLQSLHQSQEDFLSPTSHAQANAFLIQELAELRGEMRARAREHSRLADRLDNIERAVSRVYNVSLNLLSDARETREARGSSKTQQQNSPVLHKSFNLNGTERGGGTEILLITDEGYLKQFYRQAMSLRCYAWLHGYALTLLDADPSCVQRIFFFKKHCTVARYLSQKPAGHVVVVMDGDTVPADIQRRLDAWLPAHTDLTFYEREWSPEVAAGNYIVQNSAFSRRFMNEWANLESKRPPGAIFSGEDNGAIHVLLPNVLNLPCAAAVEGLYLGLSHVGVNLSDLARIPLQYKHFVAAAELVRGPPRRWLDIKRWGLHGNITVLPRMHGWVADNGVTQSKGTRGSGSVFHHGIKTQDEVGRYFSSDGLQRCAPLPSVLVERQVFLRSMRDYLENIRRHYGAWPLPSGRLVPFHDVATHCCLWELTCRPLEPGESMALGGAASFQDPLLTSVPQGETQGCFLPEPPPSEMPVCG